MGNSVSEVGTGIIIVAVVWISAVVFGLMLLRASGSAKLGVIPVFLLALSVTLALVFFPRSPETALPLKETEEWLVDIYHMMDVFIPDLSFFIFTLLFAEIVDSLFIGRYILLAVASFVFLVAFFMLLPFHLLEPVHAKALRTH